MTIWFNAWAYESTEQVWAGLADSIVQQIAERLEKPEESMRFLLALHLRRHGIDRIIRRIDDRVSTKWWQNVRPKIKRYVPLIGVSLMVSTFGWIDKNQFWPIAGIGGLVVSVIVGCLQILQERVKAESSVETESAQESLGEYVDIPNYSKGTIFMTHVIEDIQTVLRRIPRDYLPMIIFIDDLDRCSPNKVANVIEAINLFLGGGYFSGCAFIIGMDAEMVAAALEESYSKVITKLPRYFSHNAIGWRFMDKFIQLPFVIPPPAAKDVNDYVDAILLHETSELVDKVHMEKVAKEIVLEYDINNDQKIEQITNNAAQKHDLSSKQKIFLKKKVKETKNVQDLDKMINRFSEEDPVIRDSIIESIPEFSDNPRDLKRFMNVFRFQYFLLLARQANGLSTPSPKQLARWIILSIKWPDVARWLQDTVGVSRHVTIDLPKSVKETSLTGLRLLELESLGQKSIDLDTWQKGIKKKLQLTIDMAPWLADDGLRNFFKNEANEKSSEERLSAGVEKGFY